LCGLKEAAGTIGELLKVHIVSPLTSARLSATRILRHDIYWASGSIWGAFCPCSRSDDGQRATPEVGPATLIKDAAHV
jgi:hypothetical protein